MAEQPEKEGSANTAPKWILAALGIGEVAAFGTVLSKFGVWMALGVCLAVFGLFALLFGGYFLWRKKKLARQRQTFNSTLDALTTAAPRAVSDPNDRAKLDAMRQNFQKGLAVFKSHGKDIYKLPWFVIIGESGSGKTEAIRNSAIEFPPGLNKEQQGVGGTINMDWWFANQGIILDTAGRLVFNDAAAGDTPEWVEFLKLLRKARPRAPINGLFVVLSIESLIKDSAEKIAQKARVLAQHLELIQRTLDLRFPVYLLVTKSDLLTGFREFFDNIEDPLLQHQMFGWSNPDALDTPFKPELVDQHLQFVSNRLRRRRLALLHQIKGSATQTASRFFAANAASSSAPTMQGEDVEAVFALPESIMRLAPRLRRYLETIFVANEWSAKPVFLRGIYFTSSMREGKALDEAMAYALGVPVEQLPEDRSWDKNRAFFLKDLFVTKVFREAGLVTRATNTVKMLRSRQLWLMGASTTALVLFITFAALGFRKLNQSVLDEAAYWKAGAAGWTRGGNWSPSIVNAGVNDFFHFSYDGTNTVKDAPRNPTVVQYNTRLEGLAQKGFSVGWIFQPVSWLYRKGVHERERAQRLIFEQSVLAPLLNGTRAKMRAVKPGNPDALAAHRNALLQLLQLEGDEMAGNPLSPTNAETYLKTFLTYLTDKDFAPDTNLVNTFTWTYSNEAKQKNGGQWPPDYFTGGNSLSSNHAVAFGLTNFHLASLEAQTNIDRQRTLLNKWVDTLSEYEQKENAWLGGSASCSELGQTLAPLKASLDTLRRDMASISNSPAGVVTNLSVAYARLQITASNASTARLLVPVNQMMGSLPESKRTTGLFPEVRQLVSGLAAQAAADIRSDFEKRGERITVLDRDQMPQSQTDGTLAHDARWNLYQDACHLAQAPMEITTNDIGSGWARFLEWSGRETQLGTNINRYVGPWADRAVRATKEVLSQGHQNVLSNIVLQYTQVASALLRDLQKPLGGLRDIVTAREWLGRVDSDLASSQRLGVAPESFDRLRSTISTTKQRVMANIAEFVRSQLGFPVLADSRKMLDAKSILGAQQIQSAVAKELTNVTWGTPDSLADNLRQVRESMDSYGKVINALVSTDGSVGKLQLSSLPYLDLTPEDRNAVAPLRWVRVSPGDSSLAEDVAGPEPVVLAKTTLEEPLTLSFASLRAGQSVKTVPLGQWWLPRMIQNGQAKPSSDRLKWQVRVPLSDDAQGGAAVLEAQLTAPLPKREDWPK